MYILTRSCADEWRHISDPGSRAQYNDDDFRVRYGHVAVFILKN